MNENTGAYRYSRRNQSLSALPSAKSSTQKSSSFPFMSFADSDLSLVLMLILLLKKDGADEMLIMALLYILT